MEQVHQQEEEASGEVAEVVVEEEAVAEMMAEGMKIVLFEIARFCVDWNTALASARNQFNILHSNVL